MLSSTDGEHLETVQQAAEDRDQSVKAVLDEQQYEQFEELVANLENVLRAAVETATVETATQAQRVLNRQER